MEIVNMVAVAKLSTPLDLLELSHAIKGSEISSGAGRWLKIRLPPENYYVTFYRSGKFLITGVKSSEKIEDISHRVHSILMNANLKIRIDSITIHNIVIMDSFNLKASIERIIYALDNKKASYEPEQFPGLMYKDFGASFLLFSSGKVIATGIRDQNKGEEALAKFRLLIEQIQ